MMGARVGALRQLWRRCRAHQPAEELVVVVGAEEALGRMRRLAERLGMVAEFEERQMLELTGSFERMLNRIERLERLVEAQMLQGPRHR